MTRINPHYPVIPVEGRKGRQKTTNGVEFKQVLAAQLNQPIKFSGHCEKRMEQNGIVLTTAQKDKLTAVINQAENKGAKDTFVLMDNLAFLVSIKNRTVITVIDQPRMKENIFTNIDSAVIV